jgi:hypothetical protein
MSVLAVSESEYATATAPSSHAVSHGTPTTAPSHPASRVALPYSDSFYLLFCLSVSQKWELVMSEFGLMSLPTGLGLVFDAPLCAVGIFLLGWNEGGALAGGSREIVTFSHAGGDAGTVG